MNPRHHGACQGGCEKVVKAKMHLFGSVGSVKRVDWGELNHLEIVNCLEIAELER